MDETARSDTTGPITFAMSSMINTMVTCQNATATVSVTYIGVP